MMKTQLIPADAEGISRAVSVLRDGGLVAIPTETVYGLGACADSEEAVAQIYRAKGRPNFNPLIVHVADITMAQKIAHFDERAQKLVAQFWPGPLTLVAPLRSDAGITPAVTAGLGTIALRMPDHRIASEVLRQLDCPLAAPSANVSTSISPTTPAHVAESLGDRIPAILDGGPCVQGLESTIIALRDAGAWSLLREGPVTRDELVQFLGCDPLQTAAGIEAPGQLERHYSPGKPVRLAAADAMSDEFLIGFGQAVGDCTLSATGDLAQAGSRLYACLHQAAAAPQPRIAIATIPDDGIGAAINDRLRRAAA